jgi:hypothetical protein
MIEPFYDRWAREANMHLQAFVLREGKEHRFFDAQQTHVIVSFKNSWAEDMRVADDSRGVPIEVQMKAWEDCMARAREAGAIGSAEILSVPVVKTDEAIKRGLRPWEVWDITAAPVVDEFAAAP